MNTAESISRVLIETFPKSSVHVKVQGGALSIKANGAEHVIYNNNWQHMSLNEICKLVSGSVNESTNTQILFG